MGRRRATGTRPAVAEAPARGFAGRRAPRGPERVAWSYVAAVVAGLVAALVFAVVDAAQPGLCAEDDLTCALGTYLVGGLAGGVAGAAASAWLFRLGWEWWLVCATVVVAMPAALDLGGPWAWSLLVAAPALAALLTLGGPDRWRWRPVVLGGVCAAILVWIVLVTFVAPGA